MRFYPILNKDELELASKEIWKLADCDDDIMADKYAHIAIVLGKETTLQKLENAEKYPYLKVQLDLIKKILEDKHLNSNDVCEQIQEIVSRGFCDYECKICGNIQIDVFSCDECQCFDFKPYKYIPIGEKE